MKRNALLMILCMMIFLSSCSHDPPKVAMADSTAVRSEDSYSPAMSFMGRGVIYCESDEDDCTFEIHARDGSFFVQQDDGSQHVSDLVIEGSGGAHWTSVLPSNSDSSADWWHGAKNFLEVLIKKDNQYVGYAVVAVETPEDVVHYHATVVECKEILPQENQTSALSKETLQQMIDTVIQNND